jgi:hypothetical protein
MKSMKESKESTERAAFQRVEAYVANLESYLRGGTYTDLHFGDGGSKRVTNVCVAMAYYPDGSPKRSVGTFYQDIGTYTQEMDEADRAVQHRHVKQKAKAA